MEVTVASNSSQCKSISCANKYSSGLRSTKGKKNFCEIGRVTNSSHDQVRRDLQLIAEHKEELRINLLETVIEKNKQTPGFLICDGTLLLKEYAQKTEGVSHQHSGSGTKPGIGVMVTVWTDFENTYAVDAFTWKRGDPSRIQTATYRIIALTQHIGAVGVLNDGAFASVEAMRAYEATCTLFVMRFHSNRKVVVPGFESFGEVQVKDHPAFQLKRNKRYIMRKAIWYDLELYVIAFKLKHITKGWVKMFLVTNAKNKDAKKIAKLYSHRWKVEPFIRKCKQTYGLGDCLSRSLNMQEAHCLAVLLAYNQDKLHQEKIASQSIEKNIDAKPQSAVKSHRLLLRKFRSSQIFYGYA